MNTVFQTQKGFGCISFVNLIGKPEKSQCWYLMPKIKMTELIRTDSLTIASNIFCIQKDHPSWSFSEHSITFFQDMQRILFIKHAHSDRNFVLEYESQKPLDIL